MNGPTPDPNATQFSPIEVDILAQLPSLGIFTQLTICYTVSNDHSYTKIPETLTQGLTRLVASFPWVSGQIVTSPKGTVEIIPYSKLPLLVTKDLRGDDSVPSISELQEARFPMAMLDENIIAPRNTIPDSSTLGAPSPVFCLQATFIKGGLLMTTVGSHNAMDMIGQAEVMRLLSKACANQPFTPQEIETGNLPRKNIPEPEAYDHELLQHQIVKEDAVIPGTQPDCEWAYFSFSAESLAGLKKEAEQSLTVEYISTDDALTGLIWQSVARARLPRLAPTERGKFARAVDVRSSLDIPKTYPGLVQNMTYHSLAIGELADAPLGVVASDLRAGLDPEDLRVRTQTLAKYLREAEDRRVNMGAGMDMGRDLLLSSWAKVECWEDEFGLGLGPPVAVRRPRFVGFEGLAYIMPRKKEGDGAVGICLRVEDMQRLKEEEGWSRWASWIG